MEDRNEPEAIAKRSAQEDPIVMYLIVRESLGMGMGKTAAQCAHASQMLLLKHIALEKELVNLEGVEENFGPLTKDEEIYWDANQPKYFVFLSWLDTSFRKVVLRADDKEWVKLKEIPNHVLVVDAGLTEIAAGSETVIGFWPMHKSEVPKLIKKLQALK